MTDNRRFCSSCDRDDSINSVNQHWLDFALENGSFKFTKADVIGQNLWNFVQGQDAKTFYLKHFRAARTNPNIIHIYFRCDSQTLERHMVLVVKGLPDKGLALEANVLLEKPVTYNQRDSIDLSIFQTCVR